jgi:hypothetical protein
MNQVIEPTLVVDAALIAAHKSGVGVKIRNFYKFECFDAEGNLKWVEECENLLTTAGATDLLLQYFKASGYTAGWFVGLKGTGTIAAGDTMASHAGWTEVTAYGAATRVGLVLGTPAAGSVDNSASVAGFTFTSGATVAGAFVVNNSTKGGTTGTLYGAADFGASRAPLTGDIINVTVTLTAA